AHRGGNLGGNVRRGAENEVDADQRSRQKAEDELRESLPDLRRLRLVPGGIDVVGPDVTEDESPDADEDIDEDLHSSGGRENPTRLIFDALGCVLGQNERLGDGTAR